MKKRKGKRKIISRTHKLLILNIVLVCFFMLGIGYSLLSTELGINGIIGIFDFFHPVKVEVIETSSPQNGEYYQLEENVYFKVVITNNRSYDMTNGELEIEISGDTFTFENIGGHDSKEFDASFTVSELEIITGFADIEAVLDVENNKGETISANSTLKINNIETPSSDPFELTIEEISTPADIDYEYGEKIEYKLIIKNKGNLSLIDVITESELSGFSETKPIINPDNTITYTTEYIVVEEDIIAGSITLDICVNGMDAAGTMFSKKNTLVIENIKSPASNPLDLQIINISPPANGTNYQKEEEIDFTILLKNNGNYTVTDIKTTFVETNEYWEWPQSISPGGSYQYTVNYNVEPSDCVEEKVTLTVHTTADSKVGTVTAQTSTTLNNVEHIEPFEIGVTEINIPESTGIYSLGSTIEYKTTIVNNRNQKIYNVQLTEQAGSTSQWNLQELSPGESRVFSTDLIVTEADILAGKATVHVTFSGEYDDGTMINKDFNYFSVNLEPPASTINPIIETEESQTVFHEGDNLSYLINPVNTGNLTLKDITVTTSSGETWTIASLAPGQEQAYSITRTISSDMIVDGHVCMNITITAKTPEDNYATTRTFTNSYCVNAS